MLSFIYVLPFSTKEQCPHCWSQEGEADSEGRFALPLFLLALSHLKHAAGYGSRMTRLSLLAAPSPIPLVLLVQSMGVWLALPSPSR